MWFTPQRVCTTARNHHIEFFQSRLRKSSRIDINFTTGVRVDDFIGAGTEALISHGA
jgi:hypothetical protein